MIYRITYITPLLRNEFPQDLIFDQEMEIYSDFKFKFRLLDADKNIYFKGISTRNDSFDPLDNVGSEYGCTDIQFFEKGKFVSL